MITLKKIVIVCLLGASAVGLGLSAQHISSMLACSAKGKPALHGTAAGKARVAAQDTLSIL